VALAVEHDVCVSQQANRKRVTHSRRTGTLQALPSALPRIPQAGTV